MFESILPFAILGSFFQIVTILFTGPGQVRLLWESKDATTHMFTFHLTGAISATFWCIHAIVEIWNPAMALPTFIASILGYILTYQIIYYRYLYPKGYRFENLWNSTPQFRTDP